MREPYGQCVCRRPELDERRKEAVELTRWAYEFSHANSYTYAAMQAVMLLDAEIERFLAELAERDKETVPTAGRA